MKTFDQFLREYMGYDEWGFVTPDGKEHLGDPSIKGKNFEDGHHMLAVQLGYSGTPGAIQKGCIRFYFKDGEAAYGFEPIRKVIPMVLDHIKKNASKFHEIILDHGWAGTKAAFKATDAGLFQRYKKIWEATKALREYMETLPKPRTTVEPRVSFTPMTSFKW